MYKFIQKSRKIENWKLPILFWFLWVGIKHKENSLPHFIWTRLLMKHTHIYIYLFNLKFIFYLIIYISKTKITDKIVLNNNKKVNIFIFLISIHS